MPITGQGGSDPSGTLHCIETGENKSIEGLFWVWFEHESRLRYGGMHLPTNDYET
jgi:hypothetical protein